MKLIEYLKDRMLFLVLNVILFFIVAILMRLLNISFNIIIIIFIIWFFPFISYILVEFIKINNYYNELVNISEKLDKKYLISEVIKEPEFIEGKIVHKILIDSNRNMHEHIKYYKNIQLEYREYIETWVHEIKTPIASAMLIIDNNEDIIPINMKNEIKKIEDYIDQTLYYSRSNDVSNDYIVKKFTLEKIVKNVIKKNANDFIYKKIAIEIEDINEEVYSDPKWVEFIINQVVVNAIKYSCCKNPKVTIFSKKNKNNLVLSIKDNGVGINEKDIGRVFEKGFTGENGRIFGKSTGMGLYLCKKLCDKLSLNLTLYSKSNEGTTVNLLFPIGK
ncbi:ATP-binding protein [Romboutsia sp.]|uniref:ATP-binding protein n=1 Tax=Romboutsia sp. TaxID=1965302 RepID=UPI003F3ED40E